MATNFSFNLLAVLALALFVQVTLGEISCNHLDQDTCSYAISSTGKRCVLEKRVKRSGEEAYTCRTSEIEADRLRNWIETDQCITSCGLDRKSLGISSDSLLESRFTQQLCSPQCYDSCPNIVDLYFNLAAGEGVFLPTLCEAQETNGRRELIADVRSSGVVAPGPILSAKLSSAPAFAPGPSQSAKFSSAPAFAPGPSQSATFSSAPAFAPGPAQSAKFSSAPAFAPGPVQSAKFSFAPAFAPYNY